MAGTPLRGRRGRDRRIAERVATEFATRHASPRPEDAVDFDVAEVDAEVADARDAEDEAAERSRAGAAARPPTPAQAGRERAPGEGRKSGQRIPDLSVLPALLAETGTFTELRDRLGRPGTGDSPDADGARSRADGAAREEQAPPRS